MNKLHLEYLRDTGNQPFCNILDGKVNKLTSEEFGIVGSWVYSNDLEKSYTKEYVEWLENKVKV
jgi:hypothetical protein